MSTERGHDLHALQPRDLPNLQLLLEVEFPDEMGVNAKIQGNLLLWMIGERNRATAASCLFFVALSCIIALRR